jgi:superfamily II DNA/RNA helicase
MDLFSRGKIMLNDCNLLVIDEADRMLDMGFIPDIEEICTKLPKARQTLLFSATMPPPIKKLADKFLVDPKTVEVARPATANVNIDQRLVVTRGDKKREALREILRGEKFKNAIIFCNKKTTVRELYTSLKRSGFRVGQIQGDMEQSARIAELDRFKQDEINVLVASDVAARGLDIKGVSHVVNFDVPWQPDDYIHRIGRTGRAGAKGIAYTIATREDGDQVAAIEKLTGLKLPRADQQAKAEAPVEETESTPAPTPAPAKRGSGRKRGKAEEPQEEQAAPAIPLEPRPADDAKSGWNGPVPSFLQFSAL